jgi:large subunit ribosomal protein L5
MSTPALLQHYKDKVVPNLKTKLGYTNPHQVPRLEKIVVTSCMGKAPDRKVAVDDAVTEISKITGQKPSITFSKKAVANFKLREGEALGARVTLRGTQMWEFLHRFINITAPNIRDFRGISSKSFDGRGNYSLGIREQIIFPEINYDKVDKIKGMTITITTTTTTINALAVSAARALVLETATPMARTARATPTTGPALSPPWCSR